MKERRRCEECGKNCRVFRHHKLPRSLGGSSHPDNIAYLCGPKNSGCHQLYDRKAFEDYVAFPDILFEELPPQFFRNNKKNKI